MRNTGHELSPCPVFGRIVQCVPMPIEKMCIAVL